MTYKKKTFLPILLAGAAGLALTSAPASASVDQYSVEAGATVLVNLDVCSSETQLAVRGDTGTDLDFMISDQDGNSLHSDEGVDDYLSIVLENESNGCATYSLAVVNLGEEQNDFTVVLEPILENSTRVQKHIIQANQTKTIGFKACGTSAAITARGDGDTDLDFVIRNADGGVVHENADDSDETSATLSGLLSDCETFQMEVSNLGEVYNAMMLVVEPTGASSAPFAGTAPSTSLAGGSSVAEGDGAGEYLVGSNSNLTVNLPVCGATRLAVRGDGDTDLDFDISNAEGTSVHSDADLSDATFATLRPSGECETFKMLVSNIGDVANIFRVELTSLDEDLGILGPGQYQVNASSAIKVQLRTCSPVSVRANGEGNTDLDFYVTDGEGGDVHSDYDMSDMTSFTLSPTDGCAYYSLAVSNIGEEANTVSLEFSDFDGTLAVDETDVAPDTISTDGQNRNIVILNQTGETLEYIFWSNSATLEWGEDKLGAKTVLAEGQQWNVNVNDGSNACLFDFRAITAGEREIEMTRINICEELNVSFK